MPSHDDELNRLLDSLSLGTPPGSLDLDQESIDTATRFIEAGQSPSAPAGFNSRLEESLLQRASMRPVAVSGRIEQVGEGVGLVAIPPMPRRLRVERIAVIAAVAILLLASSSFFRSGSNDGDSWLLAPVASASPAAASSGDCPPYTQAIVDRLSAADLPMLPGYGIARFISPNIGETLYFLPESMVPTGPNADATTVTELEALARRSSDCWGGLSLSEIEPDHVVLTSTVVLGDDRVGAIYHYQLNGVPLVGYVAYIKLDGVWYWYESRLLMTDDDLAASTYLVAGTSWKTQLYETTYLDTQQTVVTVPEMRVPAGQPVELTLSNIGTVSQHFTMTSANPMIDEVIEPGASKTVTATFAPGWTYFSTSGEGDTAAPAAGYLYADIATPSTPMATNRGTPLALTDCPSPSAFQATAEANGLADFEGIQVSAMTDAEHPLPTGIFAQSDFSYQPAPNDPSIQIETLALSDIPQGEPAGPEVWAELTDQIRYDLFCYITLNEAQLTNPLPITQMTVLPYGRVGVLLDSDPLGFGAQYYMIYVHGSKQWIISRMSFVLPDAHFIAPPDLPIQTLVLVQGWSVDSDGTYNEYAFPDVFGIPAGTDVTIDVKNLGYDPLTFTITGTDVSVQLAPGEQQDVIVNLPPGTYRYRFEGPSGTSPGMDPGFLFAVEAPAPAATPTT